MFLICLGSPNSRQRYQESIQDKPQKEYSPLTSMFKHKTEEQLKENLYFARHRLDE